MKGKSNPMYCHGMTGTSFYNSWWGAKSRCRNKKNKDYHRYGGRGILFSSDWDNFEKFYEDMFPSYGEGLSLDRIDNSKGYKKDNCRWVTNKENSRNTRQNINLTIDGKTQCLSAWCDDFNIPQDTANRRYRKLGWTIEEAYTTPVGYPRGVARVSSIVSYRFPFKGTEDEGRYLDWLADNVPQKRKRGYSIPVEDYMQEACSVGTFIHLQMERHSLGKTVQKEDRLFTLHKKEIEAGISHIDMLKEKYPNIKWIPEKVVVDNRKRYCGTIDLVRINEETKTVWLYDWKTYGIAKKKWGLPNKYKKPTPKLKKLSLQLSLYAETYRQKGYTIGGIYGLCLHNTGCYEYELPIYSTRKINNLLREFEFSLSGNIEIKHITDMIIELRKPTEQYGYAQITIDMYKETDGKTVEQKIDEAKDALKYIGVKFK